MIEDNVKLLMVITPSNKEKLFREFFDKRSFSFILYGKSMASKSILTYFGVRETKRSIILSLVSNKEEEGILKKIDKKVKLDDPGNGIIFSMYLDSSNKYIYDKVKVDKDLVKMEKKINYHLVITIVKEGYFDLIMNASKKIGLRSGTLINAREISNKQFAEFLGINIEPERDIILMIVKDEIKSDLMKEISEVSGLKTNGKGICFSLPIDNVIGFNEDNTIDLQKI